MASNKLAFLAVAALLLQASCCAVAEQAAVMALTSFEKGKGGSGPAACDEQFHSDKDLLAAPYTDWYAGGKLCNKMIRITSSSKNTTVDAMVVDECGIEDGCPKNVIATSQAVWDKLGLDTDLGEADVTWFKV